MNPSFVDPTLNFPSERPIYSKTPTSQGAWPSIGRLAAYTDQSESTVRAHLGRLIKGGVIERLQRTDRAGGRGGARRSYRLNRRRIEALLNPYFRTADGHLAADTTSPGAANHDNRQVSADQEREYPPISGDRTAEDLHAHRRSPASPIDEPSSEPGEREGPHAAFDCVMQAWIKAGRGKTSVEPARKAWTSKARRHGGAAIEAAALRYLAEDGTAKAGRPKSLQFWLSDDDFLLWLPSVLGGFSLAFPNAEIRSMVIGWESEGFVVSWLDGGSWDADRRAIVAKTETAFRRLRDRIGRPLTELGVALLHPEPTSP